MHGCRAADIVLFTRLALRVKRHDAEGFIGGPRFRATARWADMKPLARHFSPRFTRLVLRPLTVRMNGAEPDEVYLGNFGTNLRMLLDDFDQLRHGFSRLTAQFAAHVAVRLSTEVIDLVVRAGRVTGVRVAGPSGAVEELYYDGVVLAMPAPLAAALLRPHVPGAARHLCSIRYFPVSVVVAEYEQDVFEPERRAFVFDEAEVLVNAGAYAEEERNIVRYTFAGRGARPALANNVDLEKLVRAGEAALGRYARPEPARRRALVGAHFDHGLCAYSPHHAERLDRLAEELAPLPNLHLTGDYVQGASLEACVRAGSDCAAAVNARLSREVAGSAVQTEVAWGRR
jgi:oxygen-dependent protoporphyrinogen oxidase